MFNHFNRNALFTMHIGDLDPREFLELRERRDADDLFAVGAHPQRHRRAPEPIARDGPITCFAKPIGKALLLDELGHPANENKKG